MSKRLRGLLGPILGLRPVGLLAESYFWWRWIKTAGLQWPEDFARRMNPAAPLLPDLAVHARNSMSPSVRILDVGAGPVTCMGYRVGGKDVQITAVDVLAKVYDYLWARAKMAPPVRTLRADAERLAEKFGPDAFDLVYAQNSLDHAKRPQRAIEEMIRVAKPGGHVVLAHALDEGETEDYAGLHAWNFSEREGDFVVWNREQTINMTQALRDVCIVKTSRKNGFVYVEMLKR